MSQPRSKNPWVSIFEPPSYRFNTLSAFDDILKEQNVPLVESNDSEETYLYEVNTVSLTIRCIENAECNPPLNRHFAGSKYTTFFTWLSNKRDYVGKITETTYSIKRSIIKNNRQLYEGILQIFNKLPRPVNGGATGSLRRRRPSRKYKKTKRVLRRKSGSTRRR